MKTFPVLIIISFIGIAMFSCKKGNGPAPAPSVVHKWSVVSDSAYFGANGTKHPVNTSNYFNFTPAGTMYFSIRNSGADSMKYQVTSDSTILIGQYENGVFLSLSFGNGNGIWAIKKLTAHSLIIQSGGIVPSLGQSGEILQLSR
jgi:hypothetical protein